MGEGEGGNEVLGEGLGGGGKGGGGIRWIGGDGLGLGVSGVKLGGRDTEDVSPPEVPTSC